MWQNNQVASRGAEQAHAQAVGLGFCGVISFMCYLVGTVRGAFELKGRKV